MKHSKVKGKTERDLEALFAHDEPSSEDFTFVGKGQKRELTHRRLEIQRVNVDFTVAMLHSLDEVATYLNVSRQAVIKSAVNRLLMDHYRGLRATEGMTKKKA